MVPTFDERLSSCVLCGGALAHFQRARDGEIELNYDGCRTCGLIQMNPRPSEESLDGFYRQEYFQQSGADAPGSLNQRAVLKQRQQAKADVIKPFVGAPPARHLDIGCSLGILLNTVGAAAQVGVEPGEDQRDTAAASGVTTYESLDDLVAAGEAPFDLISICHVLEHVNDPVGFLGAVRGRLAEGGRLLVEVPNLVGHMSYELAHLLAFTPESLTATLAAAGFRVEQKMFHSVPQGGGGPPKQVTVLAAASEPEPVSGDGVDLNALRRARVRGVLPQTADRWRRRQTRQARRAWRRVRRRVIRNHPEERTAG